MQIFVMKILTVLVIVVLDVNVVSYKITVATGSNLHLVIPVTIVSIWRENMHGYLSADIICSEKRTVFLELRSRKTVRFSEQIMSKDKYPCIFLKTNGDYCVYYPSNIFRAVARAGSANLSTNTLN